MTRDTRTDPAAVADVLDCAGRAVLTSCTHVHAGPSALAGTDAIGWPVPEGLRERLVDRARRSRCAPRSPTLCTERRRGSSALPCPPTSR